MHSLQFNVRRLAPGIWSAGVTHLAPALEPALATSTPPTRISWASTKSIGPAPSAVLELSSSTEIRDTGVPSRKIGLDSAIAAFGTWVVILRDKNSSNRLPAALRHLRAHGVWSAHNHFRGENVVPPYRTLFSARKTLHPRPAPCGSAPRAGSVAPVSKPFVAGAWRRDMGERGLALKTASPDRASSKCRPDKRLDHRHLTKHVLMAQAGMTVLATIAAHDLSVGLVITKALQRRFATSWHPPLERYEYLVALI